MCSCVYVRTCYLSSTYFPLLQQRRDSDGFTRLREFDRWTSERERERSGHRNKKKERRAVSGISLLPDARCSRRESRPGVLHHVHLKIGPVGCPIRAEGALVHRLFTAFVNHVPPQVLHLMVTAIAIVARESALSPRSSSILGHSANVVPHFRVIWNQEEEKKNDHGLNCGERLVGSRFLFHRIHRWARNYYRRVRSSIDQCR